VQPDRFVRKGCAGRREIGGPARGRQNEYDKARCNGPDGLHETRDEKRGEAMMGKYECTV
jgi:hypothetical protein